MKASIDKIVLNFKIPSGTSRGILKEKPSWILKISDENGTCGQGEFSIIPGLSPDFKDENDYLALINLVVEFIENELEINDLTSLKTFIFTEKIQLFYSKFRSYPSLIFGFETAALDFLNGGKGLIYKNNFSEGLSQIPINGLVWMGDVEFMQEQIDSKIQAGFSTIKIKIGALAFKKELALIEKIRARYNASQITIRVDANGAFSPYEIEEKLLQLKDLDVHSIEQPIQSGQLEKLAALCKRNILPLALDEELIGISTREERRSLLDFVCPQFIVLKPSLHGGFYGCKEWIELAEERSISWWITSALESSIGLNAISQFTGNYPIILPQGLGTGGLYTNNLPSKLVIKEGFLKMSV